MYPHSIITTKHRGFFFPNQEYFSRIWKTLHLALHGSRTGLPQSTLWAFLHQQYESAIQPCALSQYRPLTRMYFLCCTHSRYASHCDAYVASRTQLPTRCNCVLDTLQGEKISISQTAIAMTCNFAGLIYEYGRCTENDVADSPKRLDS